VNNHTQTSSNVNLVPVPLGIPVNTKCEETISMLNYLKLSI
jgi:hypothetical protein